MGCRGMRIDAWQVKVLLTFDRCNCSRSQGTPLEDLSFALSIAIAYTPMVSHGDAWQVTELLTFDRYAISGGRPSRTQVLRCQLQSLTVLWSVTVMLGR